jgi:hypothetical protein
MEVIMNIKNLLVGSLAASELCHTASAYPTEHNDLTLSMIDRKEAECFSLSDESQKYKEAHFRAIDKYANCNANHFRHRYNFSYTDTSDSIAPTCDVDFLLGRQISTSERALASRREMHTCNRELSLIPLEEASRKVMKIMAGISLPTVTIIAFAIIQIKRIPEFVPSIFTNAFRTPIGSESTPPSTSVQHFTPDIPTRSYNPVSRCYEVVSQG